MSKRDWEDEDAPQKIISRYANHCVECETDIEVGDKIVWDPKTRKTYCIDCGGDLIHG